MRKLLLSALTGAFFFFPNVAIADVPTVNADAARNHIGQVRVVCGSVTEILHKTYGTFIRLGGSYIKDRYGRDVLRPDFTAVVWSENMSEVEITPGVARDRDNQICFSGEIEAYRHPALYRFYGPTPQMTLRKPDQWFIKPVTPGE